MECDAPYDVSICRRRTADLPYGIKAGGRLHSARKGRIIYICTNGMFMRKKMREYLAGIYSAALEPKLAEVLAEKLLTAKEADKSPQGQKRQPPHHPAHQWACGTSTSAWDLDLRMT